MYWHMAYYNLNPREPYVRQLAVDDEQPYANEIQLPASIEAAVSTLSTILFNMYLSFMIPNKYM